MHVESRAVQAWPYYAGKAGVFTLNVIAKSSWEPARSCSDDSAVVKNCLIR